MAKVTTETKYVAFDGKKFDVETECDAYDAASPLAKLEGLTLAQIHSAVAYDDKELSEALEKAGAAARRNRIEAGDVRTRGGQKKAA